MAQQAADGDPAMVEIARRQPPARKVGLDRCIEVDKPLFRQGHYAPRGDPFADRCGLKQGIAVDALLRVDRGVELVDRLAAPGHPQLSILINESLWLATFRQIVRSPYGALLTRITYSLTATEIEFDIVILDKVWANRFYKGGLVAALTDIDPDFAFDDGVLNVALDVWGQDMSNVADDVQGHSHRRSDQTDHYSYRHDNTEVNRIYLQRPERVDGVAYDPRCAVLPRGSASLCLPA